MKTETLERELVLLLTASIDVNPEIVDSSARIAAEREREYAATLSYYLTEHPSLRRIVLAENSGWPLAGLREVAANNPLGKEVELLSLSANDFPGELGKGYGEALLIDLALERSRLAEGARYVAKLTGRQRVRNLTRLLERSPDHFDLLCDLRDHTLYSRLGLPAAGQYCDTRLFVAARPFFDEHLRRLHAGADDVFILEAAYYRVIKALEDRPTVVCRFPVEPWYDGAAGHWNKDYGSARERLKRGVRAALRRLAPGLRV